MDYSLKLHVDHLNHENVNVRLDSLRNIKEAVDRQELPKPKTGNDVNNHIHTFYSFSPYSPAKAVWMAYSAGLNTAGIMDHDTISGAHEFIEAGKIMGMTTTIGLECRVSFSNTELSSRRINNPDQNSNVYMALHGVPHTKIGRINEYFASLRHERNKRNEMMTERINEAMKGFGIFLDFTEDVKPLSKWEEGGSITERHILFSLAYKMIDLYGKGHKLLKFLKDDLKLSIAAKAESYLLECDNPFYEYDLLGVLKSDMMPMFYIEAKAECPDVNEVLELSREISAISAYAYLGDVGESVTGDKKRQKFEDDYIEELFQVIKNLGFNAVTYMPSRNTPKQLERVKELCNCYDLFEISGEDINSPRQSFVCEAQRKPEFKNLFDSTWALVGHELAATANIDEGMFTKTTHAKYPDLDERISVYKKIGLMKGKDEGIATAMR